MSINALIVESSKDNRVMLEDMLTAIGVNCVVFTTGEAALAQDSGRHYDFIIVSQHLKDMEAELFLVRFREYQYIDDALTIMLAVNTIEDTYYDANEAGYKLIFNKKDFPLIGRFLLEAVNRRTIDLDARIMCVEGSNSDADLTSTLFRGYRATVLLLANVGSAINAFQEQEFDLIITDYDLSDDETGDDLISFVRDYEDSDKARTPILVLSSESNLSKRTSFLRNGANDYIIKPYDNDELIARASNLIAHKKLFQQFRKQQQELLQLAMIDQLTGLYNRHSLFDIGPKYISDAARHHYPMSLLVIDVDHFKQVNDTFGHSKGDFVLKKISEVMQTACRNGDFLARFGGEEFVILLTHCTHVDAMFKAEYLRKSVEESRPDNLEVTVSVGVAALVPGDDLDSLFGKADLAVYQAKDLGRNRVEAYVSDAPKKA